MGRPRKPKKDVHSAAESPGHPDFPTEGVQTEFNRPEDSVLTQAAVHEKINNMQLSSTELDLSELNGKTTLQLKRILSFFDREKDADKYEAVKAKIQEQRNPIVAMAHHGERIWSYYYDKYVVRIVLWILVILPAMGNPAKAVIQPSHREFKDHYLGAFLMACVIMAVWKVWQAFWQSDVGQQFAAGAGGKLLKPFQGRISTFSKNRLGHMTILRDGRRAGFVRMLFIHLLKSWSAIIWFIILAVLAENYMSPDAFSNIKGLTGSFYGKQPGLLWLVGFVLFVFWVLDLILLERTGRALHDRFSGTYVVAISGNPDIQQRAEHIEQWLAQKKSKP